MIPSIDRIDHVHVFVSDRKRAEGWYREVLSHEYAALEPSLRREGR